MSSLSYSASFLVWVLTVPGVVDTPGVRSSPRFDGVVRQAAQAPAPASPGTQAPAPASTQPETTGREYFVSWGYNGDGYTKSDMHFTQPTLGNDFTLAGVQARDSKGWTDGLFSHSLTVPQYNVRFGVFFNERWGGELAFDHFKWIVREDQQVRMTGTLNGLPVDADVVLTEDMLRYQLNNGANPIFFNVLRRFKLVDRPSRTGNLAILLKAGGGFAIPHTENTVFGVPNEKGFQFFQGWNLDAGAAVRAHLWRGLYFEFEDKFVHAHYFGVNVDQGKAGHNVDANMFSFSFGMAFR